MIPGRKILCIWLAASMLFFGMSLGTGSAAERPAEESATSLSGVEAATGSESRPLNLAMPSQKDLYKDLMAEGIRLAADPTRRREAVAAFKKAIALFPEKIREPLATLDDKAKPAYLEAIREIGEENPEGKKKEKGWFARNWFWLVPAIVGVAAGIEYAAGDPLHIFTKKEEPTPPEPKDVTITLDAYNSTRGFQKDLASQTVKEYSEVKVKISDMGVTGVDPKYVAVYSEDFKKKISFDSDGEANFRAPNTNVKYHVITFDSLGTNASGAQVSYDWVKDTKLRFNKRNHVVYRKDYDGQTMEERVWGGAYLPETGGNRGVFDQLNSALDVGYTRWGSIDRQPTATTGDFSYGAGNSEGAYGWHYGERITVNARELSFIAQVSIGLAEAFENLLVINNPGGYASSMTIQYAGVLKEDGKDLFVFSYIKDDAGFTSSSSGSAAVTAAVNAFDVSKKFGPVDVGLNSGRLHAGFQGKNLGVRTNLSMNGAGLENSTTADFNAGPVQGVVAMTLSPQRKAYTAQANYSSGTVILGMSGGYDANSRIGNIAANVGAKVGDGNVMFGVSGTPEMFGFNAQATQALKDIGIIGFHGIYTKSQLAEFTALGLDAQLEKIPVSLMVDYNKIGLYENLRLGLGARILGGTLSLGLDNHANKKNLAASYTVSIPLDN